MSQEIRVLHCFNCEIFQVDIVKKAKKWKCQVCGEQQTVRKVHFRGTGSECRKKAQELNMQKGQQQKNEINSLLGIISNDEAKPEEKNKCNNADSSFLYNELEDDDIMWSELDNGENIATKRDHHHLEKKSQPVNEDTCNMFNFSSTQKWSKGNNMLPMNSFGKTQKSNSSLNLEDNNGVSYGKKRSKWDNYV